jgi:uncharacterized membrane protein HdeD (DUF308 family)
MTVALGLLVLGAVSILAALWNRDEPRKAFVLFVVGALLVIGGGLTAMHGVELP